MDKHIDMEIVKIPEKILRKKLSPVPESMIKDGSIAQLAEQMHKDMIKANGVGLAGNQVGKDLMIFVIDKKLAEENEVPDTYLNPEITEYSHDLDELEEGCLSIPEFYVPIIRAKKVKLKAVTLDGKKVKIKARGFLARVYQHETDHLNGFVIKDRMQK